MRRVTKIDALPNKRPGDRVTTTRRVAVYARVSTESDEQLTSLEAQKDYYRKLINDSAEWVLAGVYSDDGVSGLTSRLRAGFLQMIQDCEDGKIDMIFSKSVSRFARNTVDSLKAIRRLTELGIGVMFSKENIWTLDAKGEFVLTLMSSFAQEESRSISENVKWGKRKRFQDGLYTLGWKNFLGYKKSANGEIVIVEEEAVHVRRIFRLYLTGKSPGEIRNILNEMGIPTPAGKAGWKTTVITSILQNEKYKGAALLQKTFVVDFLNKKHKRNEGELPQYYIENDHEPIIAPELFDYVQEKTAKHLADAKQLYGLTGLLVCGRCGRHYAKYMWHWGQSPVEYVWQCKSRQVKQGYCRNVFIYDKVMDMVLTLVFDALLKRHSEVLPVCADAAKVSPDELVHDVVPFSMGTLWLITDTIMVCDDWTLEFKFINGEVLLVKLPEDYTPTRNHEFTAPQIIERKQKKRSVKRRLPHDSG